MKKPSQNVDVKANSVNGNEFEGEPAEISVQKSVKRSSEVRGDTLSMK